LNILLCIKNNNVRNDENYHVITNKIFEL